MLYKKKLISKIYYNIIITRTRKYFKTLDCSNCKYCSNCEEVLVCIFQKGSNKLRLASRKSLCYTLIRSLFYEDDSIEVIKKYKSLE